MGNYINPSMKVDSHGTLKDPTIFQHDSCSNTSLNMSFGVDKAHSIHTVPATPGRSLPYPTARNESLGGSTNSHMMQRFNHTRGE